MWKKAVCREVDSQLSQVKSLASDALNLQHDIDAVGAQGVEWRKILFGDADAVLVSTRTAAMGQGLNRDGNTEDSGMFHGGRVMAGIERASPATQWDLIARRSQTWRNADGGIAAADAATGPREKLQGFLFMFFF